VEVEKEGWVSTDEQKRGKEVEEIQKKKKHLSFQKRRITREK
jgi:hypothetical protein